MADTGYTPTTDEVRINTVADLSASDPLYAERLAQFDRWLAAHDAASRKQALHDVAEDLPFSIPGRDRVNEWLWTRAEQKGGE